jgi:hypothetical protein
MGHITSIGRAGVPQEPLSAWQKENPLFVKTNTTRSAAKSISADRHANNEQTTH